MKKLAVKLSVAVIAVVVVGIGIGWLGSRTGGTVSVEVVNSADEPAVLEKIPEPARAEHVGTTDNSGPVDLKVTLAAKFED